MEREIDWTSGYVTEVEYTHGALADASGCGVTLLDNSFEELAARARVTRIRRDCIARHLDLDIRRKQPRRCRYHSAKASRRWDCIY